MKLTSKGRYAVTAILDIAINADGKPVTLSDISERQHISLSYLEQLFAKLRRHGLVKSVRLSVRASCRRYFDRHGDCGSE